MGEQALTDNEKTRNRQINYFIMRYMWQVVCGRNADDTIYDAFDTSRVRYARVIDTGIIRYGTGELKGLQELTGLSEDIFTGAVRFECPYKVEKTKEQREITSEDWETLFKWRADRKRQKNLKKHVDKVAAETKVKTPQQNIGDCLRKVDKKDVQNWNFYRLCYYLKNRSPAPIRLPSGVVQGLKDGLSSLTFSVLDKCSIENLRTLRKLLSGKLKLIDGIIVYKEAQKSDDKT